MKNFLLTVTFICCSLSLVTAPAQATENRISSDNANCAKTSLPVKSGKLYQDYYGSMVTSDKSLLNGASWGITNPKPQSMAYFGGTMKATAAFARFRASIYIDEGIKAAMLFQFRKKDRNGEVLKSVTVEPGTTENVDFEINGSKQIFVQSELKNNHDTAKRIVIGNPEFYSCVSK